MKKLVAMAVGILLSGQIYAADIYCAPTLKCQGRTCIVMPKTFEMAEFYPHLHAHPFKLIPGMYHFVGAQAPALCIYHLGNLPERQPYVKIRSPLLIPDMSSPGWQGSFCNTNNPDNCPFKLPSR